MNQPKTDLMGTHIKKLYRVFLIVVSIIAAIEMTLLIRAFFIFNLTRLKHRLYFYSYLFLLIASLITLTVLLVSKNKDKQHRLLIIQTYIYSACLIIWSAFVTGVDCVANGDSGVMVYIMVCISVGVLTLINPIVYNLMLCTSGTALAVAVRLLRGQSYSIGFYINFTVFLLLAMFINTQVYNLNKKQYESELTLNKLSYTDQLTGIYNRRHLDKTVAAYTKRKESYWFVLIDVDNFKSVNDTYGHAVGDECLILIAQKLRFSFGELVFRFGGDEFAIICHFDEETVCRLIDTINNELVIAYENIDLHISAGAYRAKADDTSGTVFIYTDRALYQAKQAGKRICRIFRKDEV